MCDGPEAHAAYRCRSFRVRLVRLNVRAQNGVHAGLIPHAGVLEELQHFGINAKRDLLLGVGQLLCCFQPYGIMQVRRIAVVDLLIWH